MVTMRGKKLQQILKLMIDPQVLERCLYHSSYLNEIRRSEELEIQKAYIQNGNQIYKVVLATLTVEETDHYKDIAAKFISDKNEILIQFYKKYQLDDLLYIGKGEQKGRKEHYLEHCLILFYHIYKEVGFFALRKLLSPLYELRKHTSKMIDYKSALQEYVQGLKLTVDSIKYETVKVEGPSHNIKFTIEVTAARYKGVGTANSKKKAEQQAAHNWFECSLVTIPNKEDKKPTKPVKKQALHMSKVRMNELNGLYQSLQLISKDLSLAELDLCFTHKSYANEKRLSIKEKPPLFAWFGALVLPFLIGEWILDDFTRRANGKYSRMMELIGSLGSNSHLSTCLPNSVYRFVRVSSKNDLNSPTLRTDILQAIMGGMVLHNLENQVLDYFANVKPFVMNFIIKDPADSLDYRSYLQIIIQEIQADMKVKFESSGQNQQLLYTAQVYTFFSNGDLFLKGMGKSPSKKQSVSFACKEIALKLKNMYDLSQKHLDLPNETALNNTLSRFIKSALSGRNSFKVRHLLGGLCLESWSLASARYIVTHLYTRQMITELVTLFCHWENLYGREMVDHCLLHLPSDDVDLIKLKRRNLTVRRKQINVAHDDGIEDYFYLLAEDLTFKPGHTKEKVIGQVGVQESKLVQEYDDLNDLNDLHDLDYLLDFDPFQE
jgi:ribonuclease III